MNFYDALKEAAKRSGVTISDVARSIGKEHSYISAAISRGSLPKIDNAVKLMKGAKFKIYAIPKDAKPPSEAIEITADYFVDKQKRLEEKAAKLEEQARRLRRKAREQ